MVDENQLIQDNMGLVYWTLHKFNVAKDPDALSYGMYGLYNAIRTFDSSKGFKFSTYASVCVYNAVGTYLRSAARTKRLPCISLDEAINPYKENCDTMAAFVAGSSDTPEELIIERERTVELKQAVRKAIATVMGSFKKEAHKEILRIWLDSNCKLTQQEIAAAVGNTQSCVSRVLAVAKHRLKQELEEYL